MEIIGEHGKARRDQLRDGVVNLWSRYGMGDLQEQYRERRALQSHTNACTCTVHLVLAYYLPVNLASTTASISATRDVLAARLDALPGRRPSRFVH